MAEENMPKVALIEDDAVMLSLLQTLLEYEGFETVQLDGMGEVGDVIELLRQAKPDLILMDVHLRQNNGLDLLRELRKDAGLQGVRILIASGMELSYESTLQGADGFILKPYMPDDLVARIREALGAAKPR
jgi:DNA-binding response OmpR family regulator